MATTRTPTPPQDADLAALLEHFSAVGTQALADRALGEAWGTWCDHCWRLDTSPLPATPAAAALFLYQYSEPDDADLLLDVLEVVASRHQQAGHPNPFTTGGTTS